MRLTGRGAAGPRGGDNGDLYVHVAVAQHPRFVREDDDLICDLPLTVSQAALGVHQVLEALDGDLDLVVPAGTQHGRGHRQGSGRRGRQHAHAPTVASAA